MKRKMISTIILIIMILGFNLTIYAQEENYSVKAKVIKNEGIREEQKDGKIQKVQTITIRISEGEYEEEEYQMNYIISDDIENFVANLELKEKDNITVTIQENYGEVTNISYQETINSNYALYGLLALCIILLLIVGKTKIIKPTIIYLITIMIASIIFIIAIRKVWNLIYVCAMISMLITLISLVMANGINKKTWKMMLGAVLGISISGILMYILFDIIVIRNVNIKVINNFINLKEFICGVTILASTGISNIVILFTQKLLDLENKSYKTKSDNIMEGQRSLRL